MIEEIFNDNINEVPDDIERVIEDGGEVNNFDKESGDEDEKKDENEKEKEKPKIKRKGGPRPVLNAERLKGPRGIATIEKFFSDIKLKGKGREKEDLDVVMKRLELWTHRLYPRGQFDDCLKKIEKLGTKRTVVTYINQIRMGLEDGSGDIELIRDEPNSPPPTFDHHEDTFDQLLTSTTPNVSVDTEITSDQRERMLQNRLIAEERRAARIKRAQELKERFRAQQAANSQHVTIESSDNQTQNDVEQEQEQGNSGAVEQMEVDDNQDTIRKRIHDHMNSEQEFEKVEVVNVATNGELSENLVERSNIESSCPENMNMVLSDTTHKQYENSNWEEHNSGIDEKGNEIDKMKISENKIIIKEMETNESVSHDVILVTNSNVDLVEDSLMKMKK